MANEDEKKQLLEEKNIHLWFEGSPVALCSMKLELDMNVGAIFAYAKFVNVQPEAIKSMVCDIICYDSLRKIVDVVRDCRYDGFDIKRNAEFGTKVPFKIKNQQTRNVEFVLLSVTTTNGQTWENAKKLRFNTSLVQESIFNIQKDLHRQFINNCVEANLDQSKLILQPVFEKSYWMCACGTLNWSDEEACCTCGASKSWLMENINTDVLKSQDDYRKSEAEKIRREAEEREKREKEQQKEEFRKRKETYEKQQKKSKSKGKSKGKSTKIVILVLILVILGAGGFAGYMYGLPYLRYRDAVSEMNNGNYDAAYEKFNKMKDYLDSAELAKKCLYDKALNQLNSGDKAKAAEIFQSLSGYSNSAEKYLDALKALAKDYLGNARYKDALKIYRDNGFEKDDVYNSCCDKLYLQAGRNMKKKWYYKAYREYDAVRDYKDGNRLANECCYHLANIDYANLRYKKALERYETIKNYRDVEKKLRKLENLSKIISTSVAPDKPAVWTCNDLECPDCGKPVNAVFEFYPDGKYSFRVECEVEKSSKKLEDRYKIEDKVIYTAKYVEGNIKWNKMVDINSVTDNKGSEEFNALLTIKNPFDKTDKKWLKLYGNVKTSEENKEEGKTE